METEAYSLKKQKLREIIICNFKVEQFIFQKIQFKILSNEFEIYIYRLTVS